MTFRVRVSHEHNEEDMHGSSEFRRTMAIIGDGEALGDWATDAAVRMSEVGGGSWEATLMLPVGRTVAFKYIQLRRNFVVSWETIPGGRTVVPGAALAEACYGQLPEGHPKRVGGTSYWVDSHMLTPQQGSEIRIHIGSCAKAPALTINDEKRPLSLRMRVVASSDCRMVSGTAGHVKARLERWESTRAGIENARTDEKHGHVPWSGHVGDVVVFKTHADLDLLRSHRGGTHSVMVLDVLAHTDGAATGEALEHIGQAIVTMDTFVRRDERTGNDFVSRGGFCLPILRVGPGMTAPVPIGEVHCEYVVITPFVHPKSTLERTWRKFWTKRECLDIGHRGKGRSFASVEGQRRSIIKENTVVSFTTAGLAGAEFVELDVMLTKDRQAVIYHDFHIAVEADLEVGYATEPVAVPVDELTLEQLKSLRTGHVHHPPEGDGGAGGAGGGNGTSAKKKLADLVRKHRRTLSKMASKSGFAQPRHRKESGFGAMFNAIPTLKETLTGVPEWLGINIEIKYPHEPDAERLGFLPQYEMNSYLDDILACVFENAGNRRIIFSCFHPDVCIALSLKQARFPVTFLTCGGIPAYYNDVRCNGMQEAFVFVLKENLQGIVLNSEVFFEPREGQSEPPSEEESVSYIQRVKDAGLLLFSWGDPNVSRTLRKPAEPPATSRLSTAAQSHSKYVDIQRAWGLDGVICDNIGDICKQRGKTRSQFAEPIHNAEDVDELIRWKEANFDAEPSDSSDSGTPAVASKRRKLFAVGAIFAATVAAVTLLGKR